MSRREAYHALEWRVVAPSYIAAPKVSHDLGSPDSKPLRNHCVRCAELPCVNESAFTVPVLMR
jgi:hypothetical protein